MNEEKNLKSHPTRTDSPISIIRALTRLTIGGISLGYIAFTENLSKWQSIGVENKQNTYK